MRPFALGEEDLKELAGITVNAKEIERASHKLGEEVEEFLTTSYFIYSHLCVRF